MPEPASQPQTPPPATPSSTSERKPVVGDHVYFRDHSGDRPAIVAHVSAGEGHLTLSVLAPSGSHYTRDRIARDVVTETGGMRIQGMWRFPEPWETWFRPAPRVQPPAPKETK